MRTYKHDYAGWVEDTAQAIEAGRFGEIDREALADEVRDLGKSERHRLESALRLLLIHLLKSKYQPERETRSWKASIKGQHKHTAEFLCESPSLRPELPRLLENAYDDARIEAADQTGLEIDTFPEICEWTISEVID